MYQSPVRQPGLRLHLNENSAGCSPRVLEAIRSLTPSDIASYPDYSAATTRVEQYMDVLPGWVQLVNGLDEGLHVAAGSVATRKKTSGGFFGGKATRRLFRAVVPEPAFEMYAICADAVGLDVVRIPPAPDFVFPLDKIINAARESAIVYLTDPNNPTGLGIPAGAVDTIAASAPDTLILVDEAYADFSGRTLIGPLLDRRRNVIVGRTFAKGHGLAALRIGALIAHPETLAPIRDILPPFSLNIAAITALTAALDDEEWLSAHVQEALESRARITEWARSRGFTTWPSEANFVLVRVGDQASALVEQLATRQIYIRDRSSAPGCAGCVRVTAGTRAATDACLAAMEDILA